MSEIKRYYKQIFNTGLGEHKNGDFVKYTDHLAAIEQAKIDVVQSHYEVILHKVADVFAKAGFNEEQIESVLTAIRYGNQEFKKKQLKEQGDAN